LNYDTFKIWYDVRSKIAHNKKRTSSDREYIAKEIWRLYELVGLVIQISIDENTANFSEKIQKEIKEKLLT
jgi:hypothetical protein